MCHSSRIRESLSDVASILTQEFLILRLKRIAHVLERLGLILLWVDRLALMVSNESVLSLELVDKSSTSEVVLDALNHGLDLRRRHRHLQLATHLLGCVLVLSERLM